MITLADAQKLVAEALAHARAQSANPLAVVVLDPGGHMVAMAREDGAPFFRAEIARAKAYGALGMGADTAQIAERAKGNPAFFSGIVATLGGDLVLAAGGVLIHSKGAIIGAVGVSGDTGEMDAACAAAGIASLGERA